MIKFFVPVSVEKSGRRASVRFRAIVPVKGSDGKMGMIHDIHDAKQEDVIVIAKIIDMAGIKHLIDNNIKFIFDICDDKWNKDAELYNYACEHANLVTTTCELLQNVIKRETGKIAHIISDPTERDFEEPKFNPGEKLKFSYYGGRKSFSLFDWEAVIDKIQKVTNNFEINVATNKPDKAAKRLTHWRERGILKMHHWSFELQGQLVRESDIVLLPIPENKPLVKVKSPNRVIDGISQGRFVITNDGVESYRVLQKYIHLGSIDEGILWALNNREQVIEKIKQGQQYIKQNHSAEVIGKKWIETEKLV